MALKVKAVERNIKFTKNENNPGVWRYLMQPDLYIALNLAKVMWNVWVITLHYSRPLSSPLKKSIQNQKETETNDFHFFSTLKKIKESVHSVSDSVTCGTRFWRPSSWVLPRTLPWSRRSSKGWCSAHNPARSPRTRPLQSRILSRSARDRPWRCRSRDSRARFSNLSFGQKR